MSRTFSQKFWQDKDGNEVIWQKPNRWLTLWFVALVLTWALNYGWLQRLAGWVSLIALFIWATLEATRGVNNFRRTIGILVLTLLILVRLIALF